MAEETSHRHRGTGDQMRVTRLIDE